MIPNITYERLREVVSYNPLTGKFTWLVSLGSRAVKGQLTSQKVNTDGYHIFRIDKKLYYAHILAWFYMTSEWPKEFIDHKDTIRSNNIWENLREATRQQNYRNTPARNKLKVKGVSQIRNRFYATITLNRVSVKLGSFSTLEEAQNAYREAALKYHGEFAHESLRV